MFQIAKYPAKKSKTTSKSSLKSPKMGQMCSHSPLPSFNCVHVELFFFLVDAAALSLLKEGCEQLPRVAHVEVIYVFIILKKSARASPNIIEFIMYDYERVSICTVNISYISNTKVLGNCWKELYRWRYQSQMYMRWNKKCILYIFLFFYFHFFFLWSASLIKRFRN